VVYEPDHHLGYQVVSGLPPFLEAARSDWFLAPEGDRTTRVAVVGDLTFAPYARFIRPVFERYVRWLSTRAIAELEHMAMTGVPTHRKQQQLRRRLARTGTSGDNRRQD
jgi:hypothetical protein